MRYEKIQNDIIFKAQPLPVPFGCRISYKITLLCIIVSINSHQTGCSLVKLQIINSILYRQDIFRAIMNYFEINKLQSNFIIRYDPLINKAIEYALHDDLLMQLKNGKYKLTHKGKIFVQNVLRENVLLEEIIRLKLLGDKLTEKIVQELLLECER